MDGHIFCLPHIRNNIFRNAILQHFLEKNLHGRILKHFQKKYTLFFLIVATEILISCSLTQLLTQDAMRVPLQLSQKNIYRIQYVNLILHKWYKHENFKSEFFLIKFIPLYSFIFYSFQKIIWLLCNASLFHNFTLHVLKYNFSIFKRKTINYFDNNFFILIYEMNLSLICFFDVWQKMFVRIYITWKWKDDKKHWICLFKKTIIILR